MFCILPVSATLFPMKNFILLLFAVAIVVVFGGTAFFFWDVSEGARFERLDQPAEKKPAEPQES